MTLYLIAHVVRSVPAFDIAEQMECPVCGGVGCAGRRPEDAYEGPACDACEAAGHWWIIPTSGHRAYPYAWQPVETLLSEGSPTELAKWLDAPEDWPDHYTTTIQTKADHIAATSLLSTLGLLKPKQPLTRRL